MSRPRDQQESSAGSGPIAITGMHRSGTSMLAKVLQSAGLHLGLATDFIDPAPDNPRGFFEHAGFVAIGEDLLAAAGGAWDHVPACPPMAVDDERVTHLRPRAEELIADLSIVPRWGWKDPRTCLTIRFWLDLIPELRTVICVRHPLEVTLSLRRRNNTSYAHSLSLWHAYYETLLDATDPELRIVTHYDAHFLEPERELRRLVRFADLSESAMDAAGSARESSLRHHRLDLGLAEAGVDPATIELYGRLLAESGMPLPEDGERETPQAPAEVDRTVLDLAAARGALERRARQVSSLERQRDELRDRAAELEELVEPAGLRALVDRIDRLEEQLYESRYAHELLDGWDNPGIVRGCRELVRAHVPREAEVLVIAKGDPALLDLYGRPTTNFPCDETGRYPGFAFEDGASAVAHLEVHRVRGARFLLIPEAAMWWLDHFPRLSTYLADRHPLVADEPGVGMLIELSGRTIEDSTGSVRSAIDGLVGGLEKEATVLDWTGRGLAESLAGYNAFAPPPGEALPYLSDSIEVVLLNDDPSEAVATNGAAPRGADARDAARVASRGVVLVAGARLPIARAMHSDSESAQQSRSVRPRAPPSVWRSTWRSRTAGGLTSLERRRAPTRRSG